MSKNIPPIGPEGQDLSGYTVFDSSKIPQDLKAKDRWVCFRPMIRDGKVTKPPMDPKTGNSAKVNDPSTWATFEIAESYAKENNLGIGIVLGGPDNLVGIDLDHCITTDESGKHQIEQCGIEIAKLIKSYTEISPSGTGLRILCWGTLPPGRNKVGKIEAYSTGRYVTVTGKQIGSVKTIEERSKELAEFHNRFLVEVLADKKTTEMKPVKPAKQLRGITDVTDEKLLEEARKSIQKKKFKALYDEGLTSWNDEKGLHSYTWDRAAFELLKCFAYWSGKDREQMKRLFEQSKLFNGRNVEQFDIWYGQALDNAINETRNTYQGGRKTKSKAATNHREEGEKGASLPPPVASSDEAVLERIQSSKSASKFNQLWSGDTSSNKNDHSGADQALCNIIRFYAGPNSHSQVDRLFRQSGLMRDKWDEKHGAKTYGEMTIDKAFVGNPEFAPQIQQAKLSIEQAQENRQDEINLAIVALSDLIQRAKTDPSIVLKDKDIFKALLTLKRLDKPNYESIKESLQDAKIKTKELDYRIDEAIKAEIEKEKVEEREENESALKEKYKKILGYIPPTIDNGNDLSFIVDETENALCKLPEKIKIYQRSRNLVHISREPTIANGIKREPNSVNISIINKDGLRELYSLAALWTTTTETKTFHIQAPDWPAKMLLARPSWKFDPLLGIVECPTLVGSGVVLSTPGYDRSSGLFAEFKVEDFPTVLDSPTFNDALIALEILKEPLVNFPFLSDFHLSAMLAAMLTPIARHAIDGSVPLFAIGATTPGTGKSLLADIISIIATGRRAPRWAPTTNDDEDRKRLFSIALSGDPVILIDNISEPLGSPALDAAITGDSVGDRILGKMETKTVPWKATLIATGNNIQFKGDLVRRVIPIQIDAKSEHPEERSGFKHPNLLAWVHENRGKLVSAALTILRAFIVAGKPQTNTKQYGSFEAWSELVRGALIWCGLTDPCKGRERIQESGDSMIEGLQALLKSWADFIGFGGRSLAELQAEIDRAIEKAQEPGATNGDHESAQKARALFQSLAFFDRRFDGRNLNARIIGNTLKKYIGRPVGGLQIIDAGKFHGGLSMWKVEPLSPPPVVFGGLGGLGGFNPPVAGETENFQNVGNMPTNGKISIIPRKGLVKTPQTPQTPRAVEKHRSSHLQGLGFPDPEEHGEAWEGDDPNDTGSGLEVLQ